MSTEDNWRNQVALGWVSSLLLLVLMLAFNIVISVFENNGFASLRADPGRGGLRAMAYVAGVYALLPVLTYLLHSVRLTAIRWLMVGLGVINLLFMLMHHLSHWRAGDRPTFNAHFLDLVYHATAVWIIYCSIRWAQAAAAKRSAAERAAVAAA